MGHRVAGGGVLLIAHVAAAQPLLEQFDNVPALGGSGWITQNNSQPAGGTGWFQGLNGTFAAHSSAGYIAANYQNVALFGTISNWLILPERTLDNGDALRFWTRTVSPAAYADRLQVRLSTTGASTGTGAFATGDFDTLLLDLNPNYLLGGPGSYPTMWSAFTLELSGLPGPVTGRLAFRYFVENGGENGGHSDYIGIDAVEFVPGGIGQGRCCIVATGACMVSSSGLCQNLGGTFAGAGTVCEGFTCPPPPTGACCTGSGLCIIASATACAVSGGVYRGDSSVCAGEVCPLAFRYSGPLIEIQDGQGSATCGPAAIADVTVPLNFPVGVVEAAFVVGHTWQGDLRVRLSKEGGPSVWLVDRPGVPESTFGFSVPDYGTPGSEYFRPSDEAFAIYDAPNVSVPGIAHVAGPWKPEGSTAAFSGIDSAGRWILEVFDCAGGEYGNIRDFVLLLTPAPGTWPCYANCDGSQVAPVLSANDFLCFLNLFASADNRANCDGSSLSPVLTANDFTCFLARFNAGCS